ncbi:dethiobiotin synthase [Chryseosolibacter indicus]|uniref:ATP-dependent dethiobiotin synthetase BioD n=1 Tax=Chryseosolibacter indicus TaxID=2782351 RepID=A0ABS5VW86_9BACT|nr:dethiobiotin synthase [Chryseosolibacter indicus]MBT1704989.1 dethiobiotin synthase [Chryseosolibacter indicus]
MNYFVTGIDTDSGKTLASAILCEALKADYWKPIQSGYPRDSETIESLITNRVTVVHPETYLLKTPASPHASAKIDEVEINLERFIIPKTENRIVIEGAGGCLVPLNDNTLIVDLMAKLNSEIILVADLYLGSINHTLLTIEALMKRKLRIKGIIFNGEENIESQNFITHYSKLPTLLHIRKEKTITPEIVKHYAERIAPLFYESTNAR